MRLIITFFIGFLTHTASFSQISGCFEKTKSNHYRSTLTFKEDKTFSHKIVSTNHLFITSYEKGSYQMEGDSIIFDVTIYGVDENDLHNQSESLIRKGILQGKKVMLLDKNGDIHEKLRKTKCQHEAKNNGD